MKTRIVRIGNSKGIRIPKPLLEAAGLVGEVDVTAKRGTLIIRAVRTARAGWAEAFQRMSEHGDDALLDQSSMPSQWDEKEWEW